MMDKVSVKGVICAQCILDTKSKNGLEDSDVAWSKYLINENGELEK
jgi:hypothetical protein